uniref:ATP-dependent Clp protease proteolytic subunit n=1 Tax=Monopsis debilis var. debilis TaxID=2041136 RepID=A0A291F133_9ASTR|nr:ATP-dependent protease proteolytic subunit [Monopsis debilis var. debilis]
MELSRTKKTPTIPKIYLGDDDRDRLFNYHPDFDLQEGRDNKKEWVDLIDHMQDNRILFLFEELNNEITNKLISVMLYLDYEEEGVIRLFINSPGGSIYNGLALQNSIWGLYSPIQTVGMGKVAAMAAVVLASGDEKRRVAFHSTRIMLHLPKKKKKKNKEKEKFHISEALIADVAHLAKLHDRIVSFLSHVSGRRMETIYADLERDLFMSAEEAKDYGIIDRVLEPELDEPETETETET